MEDFRGRVAVVTGAASGIGRALCLRFAAEGARVVAADVEADQLDETAALLAAAGAEASARVTDVRRYDDVHALADHAYERFGAVDVLCNNAGVFAGGLMWERPASDFEWTLEVNLWGILHAIRAFVPRMIAADREGCIVNTASMAALCTTPFSGPYDVSKFAALAATECLAHELAAIGSKLKVAVVVPSAIATRIGTSGRNRPLEHAARASDDAEFVEQALVDLTSEGLPADDAAAIILDAIRTGQFVVPTKESYEPQIRARFEALADRRLPPVPEFD
jgi:NAD(P)-dependent dehydrogenase (short-subunit alcohol dehydrogenase family)